MLIAAPRRALRVALLPALLAGAMGLAAPAAALEQQAPAAEQPAADGAAVAELEPKQIPLTPTLVEAFLAAWPEFETLREKLAAEEPDAKAQDANPKDQPESDEAEVGEAEDPVGALAAYLDKPEAKAQIDAVLKKHNFAAYADWANTAQSVLLAFGASDPEGGETDLGAEKRKVQSEIENDAALSDDEKQAALKDLDEQFAALESFQPIPGNVDVVKPYIEKIKALFGEDEQTPN
ncbi:hypothetical protein GCM10008171_09590 [Methylopila jiangsuensis]|uniref:Uncharacterized protein n=1 Tax=Methylopila jiangsuensis TaxID=586230 RepID=A0A9W6JDR3_9HYPH|nr:hypothetical protein [Methylopila jiangsuensis]MDR6285948.1 hypothetical protein [Methylopila jiangsuensis]GLK75705.1 hypothetical protein GCM10008171_09590 [Methylopila jiangsuensis]